MRVPAIVLGASLLLLASPALADEPAEASAPEAAAPEAAAPEAAAPMPTTPESKPEAPPEREHEPAFRSEGMRVGLDLGFARASGEAAGRLDQGSPSLIPLGADVSFRTSAKVLLGFHGHLGLASRSDCLGDSNCTARGYGLGTHVEAAFKAGGTFVPYIRYGIGWEMLHQSGAYKNGDAYVYRHAFDLVDLRFGGDFRLAKGEAGRATRLGPFVGMIAGIGIDEVSGGGRTSTSNREFGTGHIWFVVGARATIDP